MNIDSFPIEFTKDLESFVKNPIQFTPLTAWDERRVAAPERHVQNGIRESYSLTTIAFALEQHNPAFQTIDNLLQISYSPWKERPVDPLQEQYWLFGWKWLDTYRRMLESPNILKSVFYRYEHTRFLSIIRTLLHPTMRSDFRTVLQSWYPQSALLQPVVLDETPPVKKRLVLRPHDGWKKTQKNRNPS